MRIDSVGGPDDSCNNFSVLDPTQVQQIIQCMQNCGTNPECLMNCFPDDLGFTFQLVVTFLNESAEILGFKLPPGTVFYPEDSSLQPMMVLHVPELVLPPGLSTHCIPTYCLAEHLSVPFGGSVYTPAAITGLQCLYEIAELTFGKTLTGAALNRVQEIIWDFTETGTLSEKQRAYLRALP